MYQSYAALIALALPLCSIGQSSFQQQYSRNESDLLVGSTLNSVAATGDGFMLGGEAPGTLLGVSLTNTDANGTPNWVRTYDMSPDGFGRGAITTMEQLPGGDFIVAGAAPELFFARIGADGAVVWAKRVVTGLYPIATDIALTSDGNFVLTGKRQANAFDPFIIKAAPDGTVLWSKVYDTAAENSEFFTSIVETPDGGFMAYGYWNYNLVYMNLLVVKLNMDGGVEWSKLYGQSPVNTFLMAHTIRATADGNYTLSAAATTFQSQTYEPLLVKIDAAGTVLWSTKWDALTSASTLAIPNLKLSHEVMPDQSLLVMLGSVGYPSASMQLVHADADGTPLASNHLRNLDRIETANAMVMLPDGSAALVGYNHTGTYIESSFLFKTDADRNTPCNDSASTASATPFVLPAVDGGITATTPTWTFNDQVATTALVPMETRNTCSLIGVHELGNTTMPMINAFPNPSSGDVRITLEGITPSRSPTVQLLDATGRIVHTLSVNGRTSIVLDRKGLVGGVYLLRCTDASGTSVTTRLVLE